MPAVPVTTAIIMIIIIITIRINMSIVSTENGNNKAIISRRRFFVMINVTFITNAISHIHSLIANNIGVFIITIIVMAANLL